MSLNPECFPRWQCCFQNPRRTPQGFVFGVFEQRLVGSLVPVRKAGMCTLPRLQQAFCWSHIVVLLVTYRLWLRVEFEARVCHGKGQVASGT
jgi:hypothetical protein